MRRFHPILHFAALGVLGAVWGLAGLYLYLSPNLPNPDSLRDVKLQTPLRIMSADNRLIGQFGEQKRDPLRFDQIPNHFINALLAAEDDGFFEHPGIDFGGLLRAAVELVSTGRKVSGGSTLTMQVARNYFLSLERTFLRKFNEILLSIEIERVLSKEEIFELYVNRVFLGHRAYGFEAAAQTYYGKSLWELSLAQQAMLAGIPKAPSRNNPLSNPKAGKARRDWILSRMETLGMIDAAARQAAQNEPVTATYHGLQVEVDADYVAEMVRQDMLERFGEAAYNDGFVVYTTVQAELQQEARKAIINGLKMYDQRHGWRGPEQRHPPKPEETIDATLERWREALANMPTIADLPPAIITEVNDNKIVLLDKAGQTLTIPWTGSLSKTRLYLSENRQGPRAQGPAELFTAGDLVRVERDKDGRWALAQVPRAQGALVSLDPETGAIQALVGGMGFELSKFNRATQAKRQPGSNFKPFLYAAALENGLTPATLINDAPIVLDTLSDTEIWRPENDSGKFYGPTRLRNALTFSRNLVSIRVLQRLGIDAFIEYLDQIGFAVDTNARNLTLALGTEAFTPLEIAQAYAMLANGGYRIEPYLIERIETTMGDVIYEAEPASACYACDITPESVDAPASRMEDILATASAADTASATAPRAQQVMDPRAAFIVTSMLQDVIQRGTGRRARTLERKDIAGKTGTTNGPRDAWFSGFNRHLVTTSWVGFDDYSPLGNREFGGTAALPIWIDFMGKALSEEEATMPMPLGVIRLRIDPATGRRVSGAPKGSVFEYFFEEFLPATQSEDTPIGTDELEGLF